MYSNYEFNDAKTSGVQVENLPAQLPTEGESGSVSPKHSQKRFGVKTLTAFLCCAMIGGAVGAGGAVLAGQTSGESSASTTVYEGTRPAAVKTAVVNGKTILSATEIYNSNLPAVVGINGSVTTNVWGQTVSNPVSGSGFVISSDGYIITNYHVIDGVSDITVFFSNGDSYDATVVGGEEDNDIAVLKIDAAGLQCVVLGDSDAIQIGENVYAVGNPLGELTFTLTGGYVSAKDREITMGSGAVMNMIQTDAAINSGNSGEPLFDQYGQVVGIVSAKLSNSSSSSSSVEGLGFAIPLNDIKDMVSSIIQNGYVAGKPNLGILMEDSSSASELTSAIKSHKADDYLAKPFSYAELLGRVKALLRRYQVYRGKDTSDQAKEHFLEGAGIRLNEDFNEITVDGCSVELSTIEYQILHLMMRHPQKIFSAQNLYESIWSEPYFYNCNSTVMVHISKLRSKIEQDPQKPKRITTVWGKGYRFEPFSE